MMHRFRPSVSVSFSARLALPIGAALVLLWTDAGLHAQWPERVRGVDAPANQTTRVQGNLNEGDTMDSLRWAERSSVACFPGTRADSFQGNHVLYGTSIPEYSEMTITVRPEAGVDVNLYAYMIGKDEYDRLPPELPYALSCEASYNFGRANPGDPQVVELNATTNSYNVVIGVAGPEGAQVGGYSLEIALKSRGAEVQAPDSIRLYKLQVQKGESVTAQGDLAKGVHMPLRWANSSQVACFPATQNQKFSGHHVFYEVDLPSYSEMEIEVTPAADTDVSIYGMRFAHGGATTPPRVGSVVCESGLDYRGSNPGEPETMKFIALRAPYTIVIAVAGSQGAETGEFELKVSIKQR